MEEKTFTIITEYTKIVEKTTRHYTTFPNNIFPNTSIFAGGI